MERMKLSVTCQGWAGSAPGAAINPPPCDNYLPALQMTDPSLLIKLCCDLTGLRNDFCGFSSVPASLSCWESPACSKRPPEKLLATRTPAQLKAWGSSRQREKLRDPLVAPMPSGCLGASLRGPRDRKGGLFPGWVGVPSSQRAAFPAGPLPPQTLIPWGRVGGGRLWGWGPSLLAATRCSLCARPSSSSHSLLGGGSVGAAARKASPVSEGPEKRLEPDARPMLPALSLKRSRAQGEATPL